jgi:hypothetical protein
MLCKAPMNKAGCEKRIPNAVDEENQYVKNLEVRM